MSKLPSSKVTARPVTAACNQPEIARFQRSPSQRMDTVDMNDDQQEQTEPPLTNSTSNTFDRKKKKFIPLPSVMEDGFDDIVEIDAVMIDKKGNKFVSFSFLLCKLYSFTDMLSLASQPQPHGDVNLFNSMEEAAQLDRVNDEIRKCYISQLQQRSDSQHSFGGQSTRSDMEHEEVN